MPNITQIETSEGIKKIDYEHLANQPIISNPNLLDNWYFAADSVIDQRAGYVIPPGVPCYTDETMTEYVGDTNQYKRVYARTSTYAQHYNGNNTSSTVYYSPVEAAIRGYVFADNTVASYGIDRWKIAYGIAALESDGILLTWNGTTSTNGLIQTFLEQDYTDREATVSVLLDTGLYWITGIVPKNSGQTLSLNIAHGDGNCKLVFGEYTNGDAPFNCVLFRNYTTEPVKIKAFKLELGSTQTLAHQDKNGNWVLNDPPPHPQQELAKCQRYFVRIANNQTAAATLSYDAVVNPNNPKYISFMLHVPVPMRITPSVTRSGSLVVTDLDSHETAEATASSISTSTTDYVKSIGLLAINANVGDTFPVGTRIRVGLSSNSRIALSADL